jgi:hypothetical protein
MAASQNGFCFYKLSIHKMQIMTKNITIFIYLIFYHREIVKQFYDTSLELCKRRSVTQPFQNPSFCCNTLTTVSLRFSLLQYGTVINKSNFNFVSECEGQSRVFLFITVYHIFLL